ncbi:MAG TPA: hypothetical protein VFU06_15260 [Longimicrobiales bacterium]|nr:hypothetical protein [Longimicrobiales bacterium]
MTAVGGEAADPLSTGPHVRDRMALPVARVLLDDLTGAVIWPLAGRAERDQAAAET